MPELDLNWNPATFKVLGVKFSTYLNEIVPINYDNSLNKTRKVLNVWSRKKTKQLTPFEKITFI